MALRIEDYALIGDCKTAALVGRDGSIDWLCWPRFDSPACFAALLGTAEHGRWLMCPKGAPLAVSRQYRPGTLILETEFQTESGSAAVVDFMAFGDDAHLLRIVVGRAGRVDFRTEFVVRFNYGSTVPWVTRLDDGAINAIAGPARVVLRTPVDLHGEDLTTCGEFTVAAGESVAFVLSHGLSFANLPVPVDPFVALRDTSPVRIGNGAHRQLQLDVFGEVADAMAQARKGGMDDSERGRATRPLVMDYLARTWRDPDEGIWEVRGGPQHFVHSKVMAWVAFDRAVDAAAAEGLNEEAARWREIADEIHAEVCERGFDREFDSFVQAYGSKRLDASLLLIPLVGFLPAADPRIQETLRAIEDKLLIDGEFVLRYET